MPCLFLATTVSQRPQNPWCRAWMVHRGGLYMHISFSAIFLCKSAPWTENEPYSRNQLYAKSNHHYFQSWKFAVSKYYTVFPTNSAFPMTSIGIGGQMVPFSPGINELIEGLTWWCCCCYVLGRSLACKGPDPRDIQPIVYNGVL